MKIGVSQREPELMSGLVCKLITRLGEIAKDISLRPSLVQVVE